MKFNNHPEKNQVGTRFLWDTLYTLKSHIFANSISKNFAGTYFREWIVF